MTKFQQADGLKTVIGINKKRQAVEIAGAWWDALHSNELCGNCSGLCFELVEHASLKQSRIDLSLLISVALSRDL